MKSDIERPAQFQIERTRMPSARAAISGRIPPRAGSGRLLLWLGSIVVLFALGSCNRQSPISEGKSESSSEQATEPVRTAEEVAARKSASESWNDFARQEKDMFEPESEQGLAEFLVEPARWENVTKNSRGCWVLYAYFPSPGHALRLEMPQDKSGTWKVSIGYDCGPAGMPRTISRRNCLPPHAAAS
jgi:hypothetical protein